MPWKETTPVDQRLRFIAAFSSCRWTMAELSRIYGISRKTGYKWATRYGEEGLDGLKTARDARRAALTGPRSGARGSWSRNARSIRPGEPASCWLD